MKAGQFCEIAQTLFGPHWQYAMARALGAHPRTIRYWASGDYRITDETAERVRRLVQERQHYLHADIERRRHEFEEHLESYRQSIISLEA